MGLACAERGQRPLFLTALELPRRIKTALAQNRMPHYLKMHTTPKLRIVDEVSYLGLDHEQASLLFQVICGRYEKQAATITSSNKAFAHWGHVFAGDPLKIAHASRSISDCRHRQVRSTFHSDSSRMKGKRLTGHFPGTVAHPYPPKEFCAPNQSNPAIFVCAGVVTSKRPKADQFLASVDSLCAVLGRHSRYVLSRELSSTLDAGF